MVLKLYFLRIKTTFPAGVCSSLLHLLSPSWPCWWEVLFAFALPPYICLAVLFWFESGTHRIQLSDRLSFMYHLVLILPCSLSLLWLLLESQPWHITTPGGSNLIWEDQYELVSQRLRFKFFVFIFSIQKIVGMSTINLKECLLFLQVIFFFRCSCMMVMSLLRTFVAVYLILDLEITSRTAYVSEKLH